MNLEISAPPHRSMRRCATTALAILIVATLTMSPGCGTTPASSASSKSAASPVALKSLRLGYFANLTHAQAVLGVSSGDFQRAIAPVELTTRVFNAGPSLIEALFAGEIDVGYVGPSPALNAHEKSKGTGIRVIAGAAANGVVIVAGRDSGINGLDDLKGKRIATPQLANTQDVAAKHYLIHKLGQADANNVLAIPNAEQLGMMQRGQIDAAWAPEPWGARLILEAGGKLIAEEKDMWPEKRFTLTLVITTPEFLQKHEALVKALLGVHADWTRKLATEPEKHTAALGDALNALTGKTLPPEVFSQALSRTVFTIEPYEQTLRTFAEWSFDLGFTRRPPDLNGLVDTALLKSIAP